MTVTALAEHRTSNGRFAPGQSGNPAGRPKGARNRATLVAEALVAEKAADLTETGIAQALAGDASSLRFFLSRMLPPAKSRAVELALPQGWEQNPHAAFNTVFKAMADAELAIDEALMIAKVIAIGARIAAQARTEAAKAARRATVAPAADATPAAPASAPKPAASPVSDLYFHQSAVDTRPVTAVSPVPTKAVTAPVPSGAPVFDLYSSTALAGGAGVMVGLAGTAAA
jgi:hypothetical protein